MAIAATTNPELWDQVQGLAGREIVGLEAYADWLGRKHPKPVCGQEMTNAMAVFDLVVSWRATQ
jgi:hypothetical protein